MKYLLTTIVLTHTNIESIMYKLPKSQSISKPFFQRQLFLNQLSILALGLMSFNAVANEFDKRQALNLNQQQQAHVLTEMRGMLSATQAIVKALATDDMNAVSQHARPFGMSMKKKPEIELRSALPKSFRVLGMAVHQDFDKIADDAETLKNPKHTLQQLAQTLDRCKGCHETFRINVSTVEMEK